MKITRVVATLAAFALSMAGAVLVAPTASAAGELVACAGGGSHQTINPGATIAPRPVNVHETGNFAGCVSITTPTVSSATYELRGSGVVSCVLGGNTSGTIKVTWYLAGGGTAQDVFDYGPLSVSVRPDGQQAYFLVAISRPGGFSPAGSRLTYTEVLLTNPLECLSPEGVTDQSGINTTVTLTPPLL